MTRSAAAGSDARLTDAARATLAEGGRAVDALIAGYLAAAGASPGVLLAPAVVLLAGVGAGARAFDGRSAQPGKGAARPRGFRTEAEVPPAARVPVPRALAMLQLLHGYRGRVSLRELARRGVLAAKEKDASERAELLGRIGDAGLLALRTGIAERALLEAAGPVAGGTLTAEDLATVTPAEAAASRVEEDGQVLHGVPFGAPSESRARREVEVLVVCDGDGLLAALAYAPILEGVAVPALGLLAGDEAVPVRRGVPRVPPGSILEAPAPLAVISRGGAFWAAAAVAGAAPLVPALTAPLASGLAAPEALAPLATLPGSRGAYAVLWDGRAARAVVRLPGEPA